MNNLQQNALEGRKKTRDTDSPAFTAAGVSIGCESGENPPRRVLGKKGPKRCPDRNTGLDFSHGVTINRKHKTHQRHHLPTNDNLPVWRLPIELLLQSDP